MEITSADRKVMKSHQPPRSSLRSLQDNLTVILFLTPAFVLFLIFLIYPIFRSAYYSLFNWNGLGPAIHFVGLNNFKQILTDHVFLKGIGNCIVIVVFSLAIQLPLALALAIMVGRDLPGRAFFRSIFFMPYVISEVITAIIWISMFSPDPQRGFLNALLTLIPGAHAQNFLGDVNQVMACVFVVLTWKYFGLHMLLFMAGSHDRWRKPLAVNLVCYRSPAWHHHPYRHLPVRFGLIDAVQPGLDHDQGRAG